MTASLFTQSWNKDGFTTCAAVQPQPCPETLAWQPQQTQDSPLGMVAINPYHPRLPMTPTTSPGSKVRKTGNLHRAIYTDVSVQHEAPSQGLRQRKHGSIATRTFHGYWWLDGRNVVATLRLESHEGIVFYFAGIQTEATSIYKTSSEMNHSTVSNVAVAWVLFNRMHFPCGIPIVFLREAVHKRPSFSRYNFACSQCTSNGACLSCPCTLWRNICMGVQLTTFFQNTSEKHCVKITKTCSRNWNKQNNTCFARKWIG